MCGLKENRQLNLEMGKLGPLDDAPGNYVKRFTSRTMLSMLILH